MNRKVEIKITDHAIGAGFMYGTKEIMAVPAAENSGCKGCILQKSVKSERAYMMRDPWAMSCMSFMRNDRCTVVYHSYHDNMGCAKLCTNCASTVLNGNKAKCFLTDKVVRKYSKACERWTKGRDISKMISDNGKR